MAFSTERRKDDTRKSNRNPYLADQAKGLSLVANIVSGNKNLRATQIDDVVDLIFSSCGHIRVTDEIQLSAQLKRLTERLKTPMRYKVLNGKSVIGVGGTFSAGKSSFLNSLLNDKSVLLPVAQTPSTSVSTYIMSGRDENITACNTFGREVKLNAEALQAISHDFREKHGLNLALYLDFVAVQSAAFPVNNVVLLDTPGFDNGVDIKNLGDKTRSQQALKSVDRLIWLVPARNATASAGENGEINFIKNLSKDLEVLLVISKCDVQREVYTAADPQNNYIVQKIRNDFVDNGINICGVIPYSTVDTDWPNGNSCKKQVIDFLQRTSRTSRTVSDIKGEINGIINSLRNDFYSSSNELEKQLNTIASQIDSAPNPLDIPSLIRLHGVLGSQFANIKFDKEIFENSVTKLNKWVSERLGA